MFAETQTIRTKPFMSGLLHTHIRKNASTYTHKHTRALTHTRTHTHTHIYVYIYIRVELQNIEYAVGYFLFNSHYTLNFKIPISLGAEVSTRHVRNIHR